MQEHCAAEPPDHGVFVIVRKFGAVARNKQQGLEDPVAGSTFLNTGTAGKTSLMTRLRRKLPLACSIPKSVKKFCRRHGVTALEIRQYG